MLTHHPLWKSASDQCIPQSALVIMAGITIDAFERHSFQGQPIQQLRQGVKLIIISDRSENADTSTSYSASQDA